MGKIFSINVTAVLTDLLYLACEIQDIINNDETTLCIKGDDKNKFFE